MFERMNPDAKLVVDAAIAEAQRRGERWLGTEHLLLAFVRRPESLPGDAARLLPDGQTVASALATYQPAPRRRDAELLGTVGVDLERVRAAVRRTFGDDTIQRLRRPVHQPWQPWRRPVRRCTSLLAGGMGMSPRLKQAFDHARRDAAARGEGDISPAVLLLGMTEVPDAISTRVLRDTGVDVAALQAALRRPAG